MLPELACGFRANPGMCVERIVDHVRIESCTCVPPDTDLSNRIRSDGCIDDVHVVDALAYHYTKYLVRLRASRRCFEPHGVSCRTVSATCKYCETHELK